MSANSNVYTVVLAGGQGSRFWPVSRMRRPKQFLSISTSGESLIQATARRVEPITERERLLIVTNRIHRDLIVEHVPYAQVLCEPVARNTAPSIGLAALWVKQRDPQGVMIVLPADHSVRDEVVLLRTLKEAAALAASQEMLITVGVKPSCAHTGYGYIKRGRLIKGSSYAVSRFFEKPSFERATKYIESGEFFWNSGMFAWRAEVILQAFKEFMPTLYEGLMKIESVLGTPHEEQVLNEIFPQLEALSIDFGVLEHAKNCAVVAAEHFGWTDVGSWDAWADQFEKDADGNLLSGDTLAIESQGCVIKGKERLIAVLGVSDMVVVDSGDALLVCPRARVQDVRKVVDELKRQGRLEFT